MKDRFTRLLEIWNNLPNSKKATVVIALVGVLAMSVLILNWNGGGSSKMRILVSGADAADLGEVVDILETNQPDL